MEDICNCVNNKKIEESEDILVYSLFYFFQDLENQFIS